LGVARLTKVTIISPRSEYAEVVKALARFEDFHRLDGGGADFDPAVQELTLRAVRLFAQADQAVKDLGLQLMPGQMDMVFRGVKIPLSHFEAETWEELLAAAEARLTPIAEEVRSEKATLQKSLKDESDSANLKEALIVVSGLSADIGGLSGLHLLKALVAIVPAEKIDELRNSVPEGMFITQPLSDEETLVLVAVDKSEEGRLDKTMKLLELKPLAIPEGMPQNPAEAFNEATKQHAAAVATRGKTESEMLEIKKKDGTELLAVRELTEVARKLLDEARMSGGMRRLAAISGYIPARKEAELRDMFGRWMLHTEEVESSAEDGGVPTLLENAPGSKTFQAITKEQGLPGGHEVDPTPIVAFVFPIFFGMMFGDVGHGLLLTLFMLLVRQRSTGNMRQWANIFLVAGISATVFGVIFGEFFELPFDRFVPIPPLIEIIHRAAGSPDTFAISGVDIVMEIAILIGVAHLITALGLDIYEGAKEGDRAELFLEKVPVFTMYVGGVLYGLAFIGVGFSFNVFQSPAPAPLVGIPNNLLGVVSLLVLVPSMLVLLAGKSVAIAMGKMKGGSAAGALANGGLEVFERISQFMSNTISYVRLAVMLLVHAALLLIINLMQPWSNPAFIIPWVIFNLLILTFEAFIVYVQDLRLHLYEFFTKFFLGKGVPFRKILPDRQRIRINWH
jgi:V/A-type H+/Na+-transporting ATPase subunit I